MKLKDNNKLILTLLIIILISEGIFTGFLPVSRGHLFTLLSQKLAIGIPLALILYFFNYFVIDFCQSIKSYLVIKVALWYRTRRTNVITITQSISNLPQRIQEDIKLSYLCRIQVWSEYLVSGVILLLLLYWNIDQPWLLVMAIGYSIISLGIAYLFNPKLTHAEILSQQAEADYRKDLSECITDITGLNTANKAILWAAKIRTGYLLFTRLQLGIIAVLPYIILLPQLLNGTIDLGKLVEHQSVFALIVVNASVLISLYTVYIQGNASERRINEIR